MKRGLVLGGGGIRGAFEIGFLEYLAKKGYQPDFIIGTSVGSLNGAIFADGPNFVENVIRAKEFLLNAKKADFFKFNNIALLKLLWAESIFNQEHLKEFIKKHVSVKKFEQLSIPLYVNVTHYHTGKSKLLSKGDLQTALLASCSAPPLFPEVKIGKNYYVDGGINRASMVVKALELGADEVLYLNLQRHSHMHLEKRNLLSNLRYTLHLLESSEDYNYTSSKIIEVKPAFERYDAYSREMFRRIPQIIEQGEVYAKQCIARGKIKIKN